MKAVRFHEYGGPDVLRYEDAETPTPGEGQVRVRVAASAFNPLDAGIRGGYVQDAFPIRLPHVPGYDVAGTVDAVGASVRNVRIGDAVVGFLSMVDDGAAAQFVVAPAEALVAAPTRIPLVDAAALPSVGTTAWQALFDAAGLQAGQRVLINGAGGSVGLTAVQLAAHAGAHVIAATSPGSTERLLEAGAGQVLDHTAGPVVADQPVDVLLNLGPVTADRLQALVAQVRPGGVVVNTVPSIPTPSDPERGVRGVAFFVHSDPEVLARLVELVDRGAVRLDVAERVPLEDLPAVHARSDAGTLRGKAVVVPPAD